jgi:Zn-finger nucleic acid-binding protein
MSCSSCGAPLDVTGLFPGGTVRCGMCGATVRVPGIEQGRKSAPPPSVEPPMPSLCPRCEIELDVRESEGAVVSACRHGHGLFLTRSVLREVERAGAGMASSLDEGAPAPDEAPADDTGTAMCPRCREPMTRRTFREGIGIVVDVCAEHGTWFDAGELRAALAAARRMTTGERAQVGLPRGQEHDLHERANATLDVALALEQARDEETARRAIDLGDDLLDTFNVVVLGQESKRRRRF